MKLLSVCCLLALSFVTHSQKILSGFVIDEAKKQPVKKATVFISGTSIGTTTDEQGAFSLRIQFGRQILIAVSPGFETYGQLIYSREVPDSLTITLKTRSEASASDKKHYEKNGWAIWGPYFLSNFLGSPQQCKIKNTRAMHFRASKETGELWGFADEPLIIENKALGYTILYQLESFHCNFKTSVISYTGFAFYRPLNGNTAQHQNWEKNRSQAYHGSLMHFMRSVYRNKIEEEGFDVRTLKKVRNIRSQSEADPRNLHPANNPDSTRAADSTVIDDLQDQVLNPDHYKDVIGTSLTGDSIAYAATQTTAALDFENFLLITYRGTSPGYQQYSETGMTSQLVLLNKRPLEIESNGSYYDPRDLIILGYWNWSEKIAGMLPFDYTPPKTK